MELIHIMRLIHKLAFSTLLLCASQAGAAEIGTFTACKQKNNGQLRLVSSVAECKQSEDAVSWHTQPTSTRRAAIALVTNSALDHARTDGVAAMFVIPSQPQPLTYFWFALAFTPRNAVATGETVQAPFGTKFIAVSSSIAGTPGMD
jgi:hypothetical protein